MVPQSRRGVPILFVARHQWPCGRSLESGGRYPHKGHVGVDTRSGAGLAHGGPCGDPQHGLPAATASAAAAEIGPDCPRASQAPGLIPPPWP